MRHVILDTDIGTDVDDLLALIFLAHAHELCLEGVTTVHGDTLLRAKIAGKYPDSADRQRELIGEYLAIGDILFKQNNESGAAEQYQNALKVAQDFQAKNPTSTSLESITHLITQKIQDLRSQEGK